jgi:hypothetical protein
MHHISTVDGLRDLGYKVRVMHYRNRDENNCYETKGGRTVVTITDNHNHTSSGVAICSSEDTFSKKLGVRIAIGRALCGEESFVNN